LSKSSRRRNRQPQSRQITRSTGVDSSETGYTVGPAANPSDSQSVVLRRITETNFSGPTPPPSILRQYEEIYPGATKIIFDQFAKQGDHRRTLEDRHHRHATYRSYLGLASGTVVSLSALALGGFAVYCGQTLAASAAFLGTLASLAYVFVNGRQQQKQERLERAKLMSKK
jgi:uncharacterized membrane protein